MSYVAQIKRAVDIHLSLITMLKVKQETSLPNRRTANSMLPVVGMILGFGEVLQELDFVNIKNRVSKNSLIYGIMVKREER